MILFFKSEKVYVALSISSFNAHNYSDEAGDKRNGCLQVALHERDAGKFEDISDDKNYNSRIGKTVILHI